MAAYATVDEYRTSTGDTTTLDARVNALLEEQSAKLRGLCSLSGTEELTDDQALMARSLVCDAARKALVSPSPSFMDEPVDGMKSTSFSANGFSLDIGYVNPSGAAYFDGNMLRAFKRSLGMNQRMGWL